MTSNATTSPNTSPRYQTRFSNGFWKTFDTLTYRGVCLHFLHKDAVSYVAHCNNPTTKDKA